MTPDRYEKVQQIFLSVCEREPGEHDRLLGEACGIDAALRAEVERLLTADGQLQGILPSVGFPAGSSAAWPAPGSIEDQPHSGDPQRSHPERVGPYAIRGILGEGGMGVVYLAEQDNPRREVALKLVRSGFISKRLLRRFEHEAQLLGRLQHPGIAQIFEAGTAHTSYGRQPYFAMELIRGKPITEYVDAAALGIRERLGLFMKVCESVEHAHQKGIVHRDLKPGNILVTDAGEPKILDFGVARATDSDIQTTTLHTAVGQLIGTLPYMSPEQVTGDPALLDTRSDVYSLGVVCYEMLAGRLPYEVSNKTIPEAIRVIREDAPTPPATIHATLDGDLSTIILKTLEKEPDRRYRTASALADDIRRFLNNEAIQARPPSAVYQMRKFAARHRIPVALATLLLLVIAASAVVAAWQAVRFAHQRDLAIEARQSAEQVAAFLEGLFEEADPGFSPRGEPSIREVLDAGHSRLESELRDEPLVRARLMSVMGSVYRRLGEFTTSRELLESALEIRRRELGDRHPDVAEGLIHLGLLHVDLGEHDAARDALEKALDLRRRCFGEDHALVADALNELGAARHYAEDFAGAAEYHRQALAMRRRVHGPEHLDVAQSLAGLALALQSLGQLDEALELAEEALALRQKLLGEHPLVVQTLNDLVHVLFYRGDRHRAEQTQAEALELSRRLFHTDHPRIADALNDYAYLVNCNQGPAQAEPLHREALAIRRAAYGNEHPLVANSLNELGMILMDLGKYDESQALLREALDIRRKHFGEQDIRVVVSLNNLAVAYQRVGRSAQAAPLLREVLAIWREHYGDKHPNVAVAAQNLADALTAQGEYEEAESHYQMALDIYQSQGSPGLAGLYNNLGWMHWEMGDFEAAEEGYRRALELWENTPDASPSHVVATMANLGNSLRELGRLDEAGVLLSEALTRQRELVGDNHPALIARLVNLAFLRRDQGDLAAADELGQAALAIAREKLDADNPRIADALSLLGSVVSARGDAAGAEPLLREAVRIYRSSLVAGHWKTGRTQSGLGTCLLRLNRFDEAEPQLQESYEILSNAHGQHHVVTADTLHCLVDLYETWGKPEQAAAWRAKLEHLQATTQPPTE